jgi:hypothetical protein
LVFTSNEEFSMRSTNGAAYILALAVSAGVTGEAAAYTYRSAATNPSAYYDWGRVRQQNEAQRLRSIQNEQHLCATLPATARARVPACR